MPAQTIAEIDAIEIRYKNWSLGPATATLPRGCTALLGTNGAGKTSLMRTMLGLQPSRSGKFRLTGDAGDSTPDTRAFRAQVGFMPQRPEFPRYVTARQALAYAGDLKGLQGDGLDTAVARAAARVDLTDMLERQASKLSGGQQQRLALAQATVHDPAFVVLDEPTAGLDPIQRLGFRSWLADYCADSSALVSTHLIEDVELIADYVLVLHDGRLVFSGTPNELSRSDAEPEDGSVLETALLRLINGQRA